MYPNLLEILGARGTERTQWKMEKFSLIERGLKITLHKIHGVHLCLSPHSFPPSLSNLGQELKSCVFSIGRELITVRNKIKMLSSFKIKL